MFVCEAALPAARHKALLYLIKQAGDKSRAVVLIGLGSLALVLFNVHKTSVWDK